MPTMYVRAARHGGESDPRYEEARRDLRAQLLADHVEKVLADWPPLTDEQRSKLAELLRPVRMRFNPQSKTWVFADGTPVSSDDD